MKQGRSPGAPDEVALLRRVAAGDQAALAALYDRYASSAFSLAGRLVGAAVAEDVVHDAFVALVDKPGLYDPTRGAFRAWFLTVVHHRCLNHLRAARPTVDPETLAAMADDDPEPAEAIVRRLASAAVREALRRLPSEQREVLVLAYYGGLSQSALAARLDLPLGTVKARVRRGLIALRALLGDETTDRNEETR